MAILTKNSSSANTVENENVEGVNFDANGLESKGEYPDEIQARNDMSDFMSNLKSGFVAEGGVSANLGKLKETAEKFITSKRHDVKVLVLDKTILTNLGYSSLVFYKKVENEIRYFIAVIAASGRKSLTAKETLNYALASKKDINSREHTELYTYANAIDKYLHSIIHKQIAAIDDDVKNNNVFRPLDGIVIPYDRDPETVIESVTVSAVNALAILDYTNKNIGLSIKELMGRGNDKYGFKYKIETIKEGYIHNRVGDVVKADFTATIELKNRDKQREAISINQGNQDEVLVQASGYISALPIYWGEGRFDQNRQPLPVWTIAPHIVITNIRTLIPDTASMLLGVISGILVGADKQWVRVVLETMTEDRHPGLVNLLTRETKVKRKRNNQLIDVVEPIDLMSLEYTPDDKAIAIDRIYSNPSPIISVDATALGEGYDRISPLEWARESSAARTDILKSLGILVGGTVDYNGNIIYSKNVIPAGSYPTKKGRRDFRDLELEKLLSLTAGEDEVALRMYLGSIMKDNPDSYNEKVELLGNFLPDASLDSRTTRLTLEPDFVNLLVSLAKSAGLTARVDDAYNMPSSGIKYEGLSAFGGYNVNNSGLNGVTVRSHNTQGVNEYNPFGVRNINNI